MKSKLQTEILLMLAIATAVAIVHCGETRKPGPHETYRQFLVNRAAENPAYGLHSYLLMGRKPISAAERALLRSTLESYLTILETSEVEGLIPEQEINVTWLPIKVDAALPGPAKPTVEHLMQMYDHGYSQALLRKLDADLGAGPYLISTQRPLSQATSPPQRILFQDLTDIDPRLAKLWVQEFLLQSEQPEFWRENNARIFALRLRDSISKLAAGLETVISAAELNKRLTSR